MTVSDADFAALRARVDAIENASGLYVSEKELDSPKGSPEVKFQPRDYRGASMVGRKYSACTPEFLDLLAEALQYSGTHPKPDKIQFAKFNLLDAARARSWARRLRAGWKPPAADVDDSDTPDYDEPSYDD